MEYIVAIVAITCATGLIKTWIDRKQSSEIDEETFNRLARAFMEHKKEMTKRIENLETIIAESDTSTNVDFEEIEASNSGSKLANDLNQKDRVRS